MSESHNDNAMLRGVGAGLLAALGLGLAAGLVAVFVLWQWPADMGEKWEYAGNLAYLLVSGLTVGGVIGLVMGVTLAWHGGSVGATLNRGEAAPIYGVLTGIVLG